MNFNRYSAQVNKNVMFGAYLKSRRAVLFLALVCIFIGAGINTASGLTTDTSMWVKQFTGTIADKPVVAMITKFKDRIEGHYYYVSASVLIKLENFGDTLSRGSYTLYERVETKDEASDTGVADHWVVQIADHTIKGKWIGKNNTKQYDIDMAVYIPTNGNFTFISRDQTETTNSGIYKVPANYL